MSPGTSLPSGSKGRKVYQDIDSALTKMIEPGNGAMRIDRWLWLTRFYKTRGIAARAVTGGHVRVNGDRIRPAGMVRPGDRIDILRNQLPYRLSVKRIPTRRGPAAEARLCYEEDPAVVELREAKQDELKSDRMLMPRTSGRPDKHTRRELRERRRRD